MWYLLGTLLHWWESVQCSLRSAAVGWPRGSIYKSFSRQNFKCIVFGAIRGTSVLHVLIHRWRHTIAIQRGVWLTLEHLYMQKNNNIFNSIKIFVILVNVLWSNNSATRIRMVVRDPCEIHWRDPLADCIRPVIPLWNVNLEWARGKRRSVAMTAGVRFVLFAFTPNWRSSRPIPAHLPMSRLNELWDCVVLRSTGWARPKIEVAPPNPDLTRNKLEKFLRRDVCTV